MPSTKSTIVGRIAAEDEDVGNEWLLSVYPPFEESCAHRALLQQEKGFATRARFSFGHRVDGRSGNGRFPDALMTLGAWEEEHLTTFKKWNVDIEEGGQRLSKLDTDRVGAILCVAEGTNGRQYITVVGGPVITPVDLSDGGTNGAPNWHKNLPSTAVVQYKLPESRVTHSVAASMASFSRERLPETMPAVEDMVKPVLLTPDTQFCTRVSTRPSRSKFVPYKTLFLPMYCDPPVGIYVPVDYGYEAFCALVDGQRPYGAFNRLLKVYSKVFKAWFEAAAADASQMAVHVQLASHLWQRLPSHQNDSSVMPSNADPHTVDLFLFQRQRLLWRYYCDCILCGPSSTREDEASRGDFLQYLQAADAHTHMVDEQLGWQDLAAADFPFLPLMFRMRTNQVVGAFLRPFLQEATDVLRVPNILHGFTPIDLQAIGREIGDDDEDFAPAVDEPSPVKNSRFRTPLASTQNTHMEVQLRQPSDCSVPLQSLWSSQTFVGLC